MPYHRNALAVIGLALLSIGCSPEVKSPLNSDGKLVLPRPAESVVDTPVIPEEPKKILGGKDTDKWIVASQLPLSSWYALYAGGHEIGYSHVEIAASKSEGSDLLILTKRDVLGFSSSQKFTLRETELVSRERPNGQFLSFTESSKVDGKTIETTGELNKNTLLIKTGEKEPPTVLNWPSGAWGPLGTIAILRMRATQMEASQWAPFTAEVFIPQLKQIAKVQFSPERPTATPMLGGEIVELSPVEIAMQVADTRSLTKNWINSSGEIAKSVSDGNFQMFQIDKARADQIDTELRIAQVIDEEPQVVVPIAEPNSDKVIYQIDCDDTLLNSTTFDSLFSKLSQRVNQQVKALSSLSVKVTVWKQSLDRPTSVEQDMPTDACLAPIDADSPLIQELSKAPGELADSLTAMKQLTENLISSLAKETLSRKFERAQSVAARRAGDCKGHSVLLVALLRARQIPARVASGLLVQQSGVATYHMWCEAWEGSRWISLDPSLGTTTVAADHIKFLESPPDIENPNSLVYEVLKVMPHLTIRILPGEN
jgi:Transglutaminase-like superfamily